MQNAGRATPLFLFVGLLCAITTSCTPSGNNHGNQNDNTNPSGLRWQLVQDELPGALLSISGASANEVYSVGADPGDGTGPYVVQFDGTKWTRLNTGAEGDLWWISDKAIDGNYYLAGENGLILRFDPSAKTFEQQDTPGTELLFGVWGTDSSHIWAVGGNPEDLESDTGGVIWRYDGQTWTVEDLSFLSPDGVPPLFKVWGRAADDVYVCGFSGVVLHYDGANWQHIDTDTGRRLFTIHGNDSLIIAVGGFASGVIEQYDGFRFSDVATQDTPQLNGVFVPATGTPVAVGVEGMVEFRGDDGQWTIQTTGLQTARDFHGAWVDPDGGVWAVGGNVQSDPLVQGIVAYYGTRTIPRGVE